MAMIVGVVAEGSKRNRVACTGASADTGLRSHDAEDTSQALKKRPPRSAPWLGVVGIGASRPAVRAGALAEAASRLAGMPLVFAIARTAW